MNIPQATARGIKLLDHIPPYTTHKIGVVYVGRGQVYIAHMHVPTHTHTHTQTSEAAILANSCGSSRYLQFLSSLGQLRRLSECDPDLVYLGGLDRGGNDGEFSYFFLEDTTQGAFNIGTPITVLFF